MTASAPAPTPTPTDPDGGLLRRVAQSVLTAAVRGRRERGGPWGEAVLGEFHRTRGGWEAVRWAAGGLRAVWQERRNRVRELPRFRRISRRLAGTAVLAVVAALLVDQFLLTSRYMPSGSMEPTLLIGDRFLVDRVSHRFAGPHHGDLVEFGLKSDGEQRMAVKRVIGLPGDAIECRGGRVLRNGTALDEPYLEGGAERSRTECAALTVPDGTMYVLGDHREVSIDSRMWGPVLLDTVEGRVLARYWPYR